MATLPVSNSSLPRVLKENPDLGKFTTESGCFPRKIFIAYDKNKRQWSILKLNPLERSLRFVFGAYRSTHLDTITEGFIQYKITKITLSPVEISFETTLHKLWQKIHGTVRFAFVIGDLIKQHQDLRKILSKNSSPLKDMKFTDFRKDLKSAEKAIQCVVEKHLFLDDIAIKNPHSFFSKIYNSEVTEIVLEFKKYRSKMAQINLELDRKKAEMDRRLDNIKKRTPKFEYHYGRLKTPPSQTFWTKEFEFHLKEMIKEMSARLKTISSTLDNIIKTTPNSRHEDPTVTQVESGDQSS